MTFEELENEFSEELNGAIKAVNRVGEDLHLTFECDHWRDSSTRLVMTICCSNVADFSTTLYDTSILTRTDDHPLLWQYAEQHAMLYFSSAPPNAFELLGRLYVEHFRLFTKWRSLSDYIHATPERLNAGYGLLAQGPTRAISAYEDVAAPYVRCSLVPSYTPRSGNRLLLMDGGFVICQSVSLL